MLCFFIYSTQMLITHLSRKKGDIMTEKDHLKRALQNQLEEVKQRLQILDLTEERLIEMRELAEKRVRGKLTAEEIQEANSRLKTLEQQIKLLSCERTLLS